MRSVDVKSTELNTEKGLKTRHFRELEMCFRFSLLGMRRVLLPGRNEGRVDRLKMGKVEWIR